ncbi:RICIN domain-containing protein [Streptomyces sp. YS-3]|uniref:RICIN domain-containing protein n=1 Tax=Streptomyces sp. YS-3 TaxID=3381352 RepID=UPI0038627C22
MAFVAGAAPASAAGAASASADSTSKIVSNYAPYLCVNGGGSDGWQLQMGGCSGLSHPYYNWTFHQLTRRDSHGGAWWEIKDIWGRCMDADLNHIGDGGKVQDWTCNGAAQQHWYLWPLGGGNYEFINGVNTNYVLDAVTAGANNPGVPGDHLQLWTANYKPQQQWYVSNLSYPLG